MHPDLYPYEQTKSGGKPFASRWGPGPGKEFNDARSGDFRRLPTKNVLGLGTYEFNFTTQYHADLERTWAAFKRLFDLRPVTAKPEFWPVKGTIWANAPALFAEGDGMAWLCFLGKAGTRWEPLHLYAIWSDRRILMRTWCAHQHWQAAEGLIARRAAAICKATAWVHKRDLFS